MFIKVKVVRTIFVTAVVFVKTDLTNLIFTITGSSPVISEGLWNPCVKLCLVLCS